MRYLAALVYLMCSLSVGFVLMFVGLIQGNSLLHFIGIALFISGMLLAYYVAICVRAGRKPFGGS